LSRDFKEIVEEIEQLMTDGLELVFLVDADHPKHCLWMKQVDVMIHAKILSLKQDLPQCDLLITTTDSGLQLMFFPITEDHPVIHLHDNDNRYFVTYERSIPMPNRAVAAVASEIYENKPKANAVKRKDPMIDQIGDPRNLQNYFLDSGATQHMMPQLADLEDVMEGKHLRVEVADGHIIKCPATGKICINMLDDNGNILEVKLQDVMYVPGLSRRLFSITRFVRHGHHATFTKGTTILKFAPSWATVSLTNHIRAAAFAAGSTVIAEEQSTSQYHEVPAFRNANNPSNHKHLPLELIHPHLGPCQRMNIAYGKM